MKALILVVLGSIIGLSAQAGRNQHREKHQENRISHGVQNGELTKRETRKLKHGQNKVDKYQDKAQEDGELSRKEKARLEKMQDKQSRVIYRQKHDGQSRHDKPNQELPATPATEPAE